MFPFCQRCGTVGASRRGGGRSDTAQSRGRLWDWWVRGCLETMRPKARGLAQHGGPPAWLAGRRVARQVWFCTWWTGRTVCLFRTVPVALTGAAQLRADGISSCCYIVKKWTQPSAMSYVMQGRHGRYCSRQCLLSVWKPNNFNGKSLLPLETRNVKEKLSFITYSG